MKTCPFCAEEIQDEAIKCKHCGSMLDRPATASSVDRDKEASPPATVVPAKKKTSAGVGCLSIILLVLFVGWCASLIDPSSSTTPISAPTGGTAQNPATPRAQESGLTGAQRNAARSAQNYLSFSGFSRRGLIAQLSSEYGDKFSVADATAAVDSLNVDWNTQAARSATQYLTISGFSCQGLIDQLSSDHGDKYTREQAAYGAKQAGAC